MGLLTPQGPPEWHPAPQQIRDACAAAVELAQSRGEDIVKCSFKFTSGHPDVATCLVGATSMELIDINLKWMGEEVDPDFIEQLQNVLAPIRNRIWVEQGSEENIALATHGFWAVGHGSDNMIRGQSKNLG